MGWSAAVIPSAVFFTCGWAVAFRRNITAINMGAPVGIFIDDPLQKNGLFEGLLRPDARPPRTRQSSVRFVRSIFHPRVRRDPVDFPGLAPVVRERLLEPDGIGRDVRDDEANKNGPAVKRLLVVELAAAVLELADRGQCHHAAV